MSYYEDIQRAIDYIEERLRDAITLECVADQAYCSLTHFYRVFRAVTGRTIKEYVRMRRLSEAARELVTGKRRIIDIAFDYGYSSQEAFTRAFGGIYGVTPGSCRDAGFELPLFERVNVFERVLLSHDPDRVLRPEFRVKNAFAVVGKRLPMSDLLKAAVCSWYEELAPVVKKFPGARRPVSYERAYPDPFCVTGVEIGAAAGLDLPAGMEAQTVPPAKYVTFDPRAKAGFIAYLRDAWLPASGYALAADYAFAVYDGPDVRRYVPVRDTGERAALPLHPDRFTSLPFYEKRRNLMEKLDVRIVELEPMRVAYTRAISVTPESDAWQKMQAWAEPLGLFEDREAHPVFGFNNPNPSPGKEEYGYEFMIAVGPEIEPEGDIKIKDFPGGLYAVTRNDGIPNIGETWARLNKWVKESAYRPARHQWLEHNISDDVKATEEDMVHDLYHPIAR